jgi:hypothetical protein
MLEILCARKAFAISFDSSDDQVLVVMIFSKRAQYYELHLSNIVTKEHFTFLNPVFVYS